MTLEYVNFKKFCQLFKVFCLIQIALSMSNNSVFDSSLNASVFQYFNITFIVLNEQFTKQNF